MCQGSAILNGVSVGYGSIKLCFCNNLEFNRETPLDISKAFPVWC